MPVPTPSLWVGGNPVSLQNQEVGSRGEGSEERGGEDEVGERDEETGRPARKGAVRKLVGGGE